MEERAARRAAGQARPPARRRHRPVPARLRGRRADRDGHAAHEGLADGEETEARTASPAGWPRAAARARWPSSTSSTARGASSCRPRSTSSARRPTSGCSRWTSATSRRRRHRVPLAPRRAVSLRVDDFTVLAKSLRPPPDKHHGLQDVETRYRRRELDLMANEEARDAVRHAREGRRRGPPPPRRRRLRRGRDPGAAAALRRRAGAAVHDAPQRAGPRRCTCASPPSSTSSAASSAAWSASTSWARTSATRASPTSTTPSSRWSSSTRPTPTTRTPPSASRRSSPSRPAQARIRPGEIDFTRALAARDRCATRSPRRPASTCSRTATATRWRGDRAGDSTCPTEDRTWPQLVDDLLSKFVEPTLQAADVRRRLPGRAVAVRQGPPLRAGPRRALGGVLRRDGDRQRVHRAQRPRRAARALRGPGAPAPPRATRRRSRSTRRSSRRSSRACRRPAGVGLGIDRLVMVLTGQRLDPRGRPLSRDARLNSPHSSQRAGRPPDTRW